MTLGQSTAAGLARSTRRIRMPAVGEVVNCVTFAREAARGNPTAVVRLPSWPHRSELARLASSMPAHETTFIVLDGSELEMRWFSKTMELPLCGHGALAAAAVLARWLPAVEPTPIRNLPGRLWLAPSANRPAVLFGAVSLRELPADVRVIAALGLAPTHVFDAGRDLLVIVSDESALRRFDPTRANLTRLSHLGCLISSSSETATAAFRFFAPRAGIIEDAASASAIPALMAFWRPSASPARFIQRSSADVEIAGHFAAGGRVGVAGAVTEIGRYRLEPWSSSTSTPHTFLKGY